MPDSPRDPAAEAEKMLSDFAFKYKYGPDDGPGAMILKSELLALLRELVERREGDRWIPVNERMPERHVPVWTLDELGDQNSERYFGDIWELHLGTKVTHWRPLPAPPAEEKPAVSSVPARNQVPGHPSWYFGVFERNKANDSWKVEVNHEEGKFLGFEVSGTSRDECIANAVAKIVGVSNP